MTVGLLVFGCSGSSQPSTPQTSTPWPTPSWTISFPPSTTGPFTPSEKAGKALVSAKAAAVKATSVHLEGLLPLGEYVVLLDLDVVGNSARGAVKVGDGVAQVVAHSGILYVKGDRSFWQVFEGSSRSVLADHWVQVSATTSPVFGDVLSVMPVPRWLDALVPVGQKYAEVPGKSIDGMTTMGIRRTTATSAEIHVLTTDPGYAVLVVPERGGAVKLSGWNAKVDPIAPPSGKVLDATRTELGGR